MKTLVSIFLVISIICVTTYSLSNNDDYTSKEVGELFEERYSDWIEWKESPAFAACSDTNGTVGRLWEDIISLGPASLPYIIDKIKVDPDMSLAFTEITRIAPREGNYDNDESMDYSLYPETAAPYLYWWNNDRMNLQEDIENDVDRLIQIMISDQQDIDVQHQIDIIRREYGIFLMPYILNNIENGNTDLVQIAWYLLDAIEGDMDKRKMFVNEVQLNIDDTQKRLEIILDTAERNKETLDVITSLIQ